MLLLEELRYLEGHNVGMAVLAALIFFSYALVFSHLWRSTHQK